MSETVHFGDTFNPQFCFSGVLGMVEQVFSQSQQAALKLMAEGRNDTYIAKELCLTKAELQELITRLFCQCGVSSRVELILFCYSQPADPAAKTVQDVA